ncbi:signal peptidase I [Patescibacteria group bacterium]|nr:signal peptidase I [Patescibacteria group bacterium]
MLKRLGAFFLDVIEVVVFAIAIFLFMYLLVMQPHKIKGDSMQPNFPDGEYLLTDKVSYRFREPERGEVVVFEAPGANGDEFIKRIIALSGEKIMLKDKSVFINGQKLEEAYLSNSVLTKAGAFLEEGKEILVPEGSLIVFGDNRTASSDSRAWGFVAEEKITGRAWVTYWPPSEAGLIKEVVYSFN